MPQIVICYADFFNINRFIAKDKTKLAKLRANAFGVKKIVIIQCVLNLHKTIKAFI